MTSQRINKILITGTTGFIGGAFYQRLIEDRCDLRLLLRSDSKANQFSAESSTETVICDLLNAEGLRRVCSDVEIVVHLAGVSHVSSTSSDNSRGVIVDGTINLLNAAIANNVKRIIYMSSSLADAVDTPAGDITDYGKYKKMAELALLEANRKGLIEVVILRPVNVYGVGMKGNIAKMISLIGRNRLPPLPAVKARISLVGVNDVVQALHLALQAPQANGNIYTITDGYEYAVVDIEKSIYQALGKDFPAWRTPLLVLFLAAMSFGILARVLGKGSSIGIRTYRNFTSDNLFENTTICEDLGYAPTSNLYLELPQIVEHILEQSD